ncbi:MAG: IclR family transcriptional regulator [Erythrobacter sp.]|nr:IclR family transcriptional regulator [Erythrobacter sp.]
MRDDAKGPVLASTLERGMRILALFAEHQTPLGISEIARLAGLEKSAAHRLASTLLAIDYLERDDTTRRYRPGLKILDLAFGYLIQDRLLERAVPRIVEASRALGVTINIGVLDGADIVYKARIPSTSRAYDSTLIGTRRPAVVTAAGQIIAAFSTPDVLEELLRHGLPEPVTPFTLNDPETVRALVGQAARYGYVISHQQMMLQEIVVAAPILGSNRRAVAAISMSVYMPEWDEDRIRAEMVPELTNLARTVSSPIATR